MERCTTYALPGRIKYNPTEWPAGTFDMDTLALQVVPNPNGAFPWSRYCSILGTPGLSAFAGFETYCEAKKVHLQQVFSPVL